MSKPALRITEVAIAPAGPSATFDLAAGSSLAIVGPAGAGKSLLLDTLAGRSKPARGKVAVKGSVSVAELPSKTRRLTPLALAPTSNRGAEALDRLALWDVRKRPLHELSPSQIAACALLSALAADPQVLVIDEWLDRLDPWTLPRATELLRRRLAAGGVVVLATQRLELAAAQLAWLAAVVALIGPAWERQPVPAFRSDEALVVALDLSEGMLREARRRRSWRRRFARVCGDAMRLPLKDASVDLVFSNLTLQWCPDLAAAFRPRKR